MGSSTTSTGLASSSSPSVPRLAQAIATTLTVLVSFTLISIPQPCSASSRLQQAHLSSNTEFIKASCGYTTYPHICYRTLSSYASTIQTSPTELANAALSVALKGTQSASNMVAKLSRMNDLSQREAGAVTDCVENMSDSVDKISQSLVMMKDLEGPEFEMKISNVETWVSAALTDEDTCMDGFDEVGSSAGNKEKVRGHIRSHVVRVAQLTSNALALVNRL